MDRFTTLLITSLGIACICAGYKLFCGLPALNGQRSHATRSGVILLNIIPGILLALIGAGLLVAQVNGAWHHQRPGEGTSWHPRKSGFLNRNHAA